MSRVIRWEDPPPLRGGRKLGVKLSTTEMLAPAAEELRARPGAWGVMFEGENGSAVSVASRIRHGLSKAWSPPGAFEASARKIGDHTVVYARYVGEDR